MNKSQICLKAICDLLPERFYVPAYQRGYRWTERQVVNLLDDIWEFQSEAENKDKDSFYCLQPIVVAKREDGSWELVDGQQRLTTILLILRFLKDVLAFMKKTPFDLTFETRPQSAGFLREVDPSRHQENIDFFHISNAFQAIDAWFSGKDGSYVIKFAQCLTNANEIGKNVKVIWYELPSTEDPVQAFTRLNVGKIPLTNSELIRALFLRSGNFDVSTRNLERLAIAQEWDSIEKALQNEELWYFLQSGIRKPSSRIQYIFELLARESDESFKPNSDPYGVFYFFNQKLGNADSAISLEWLRVKQYFMQLEEWFNDRTLFHLVGFLVQDGDEIFAVRKIVELSKDAFRRELKQRILSRLLSPTPLDTTNVEALAATIYSYLEELDYDTGSHKPKIKSVLLLFNIATLLQNRNSNLRFPFDRFKKESWDIEHIHSIDSSAPLTHAQRIRWLEDVQQYFSWSDEDFSSTDEINAVITLLQEDSATSKNIVPTRFESLYKKTHEHFDHDDETAADNGIGNLTLLDSATNRGYKNAVFPVKRKEIIDREKEGVFIPLCTRNVFMKSYSQKLDNMLHWTSKDRTKYQRVIAETLADFFANQVTQ